MVTEEILRSEGKIIVDISKHMDCQSGWNQAMMEGDAGGPACSDTNTHFAQVCNELWVCSKGGFTKFTEVFHRTSP